MIGGSASRSSRSGIGIITVALPLSMFVLLSFAAPSFFTGQNIGNISNQIAALLITSLGQLIVAISGGVDLSVGSTLSLTSAIIVSFDPSIVIPLALFAGCCIGVVNGVGVAVFGVHPLVMTLATATFVQGLTFLVLPTPGGVVPPAIERLAESPISGLPGSLLWCAAAILFFWLLLSRSSFGLRLYAIGANPRNAALNGVKVVAPIITCYVLCSLSAVAAGVFLTARVSTGDPTVGASFGLDSVTVIALGGVQLSGGIGSVPGVILGAITLGLATNGMNLLGVSPFLRMAATGLLLLGAISLQRRKTIGV
ncbi:ABC transporter permease [Aquibium carbonis]|uniref:ABC transporter permease n=1 Tax=Aquibium carbonis TaxID=2495581 RepID=A0A429YR43_9HYPH|nr:ABC transporter permease [Aquibium carbonis]RST83891.1 ABC transporter permease [Aquibium carbonis]